MLQRRYPIDGGKQKTAKISHTFQAIATIAITTWLLSLCATTAQAQCQDLDCAIKEIQELIASDQGKAAVEAAKNYSKAFPDDRGIQVLLGVSYLTADNTMWAIRVLTRHVQNHPDDCEARTWLARAYLTTGKPDMASEALKDPACSDGSPVAVRALMLKAVATPEDTHNLLLKARKSKSAWKIERLALPSLIARQDSSYMPDLSWRLEASGGWTSNPRMGSPTDATSDSSAGGSALSGLDFWLNLSPETGIVIRPVLEFQTRMFWLFAKDTRKLSYVQLGGKVGLQVWASSPRIILSYRPDLVIMPLGFRNEAGPVSFSAGHRGELEIEISRWVTAFFGAGRRIFRELPRTRTEVDLALGGHVPLGKIGNLVWAGAGRVYRARHPAYNLHGASLALSTQFRLPKGFLAKASASFSADWYPDSAGFGGIDIFGSATARRDLLFRVGPAFFSPDLKGVRIGLGYDYSNRLSTAQNYAFDDHRITLKVAWTGDKMLWGPGLADSAPIIDMPWDTSSGSTGLEERVQDLLRQDEQVQRSSSCVQ